MQSIVFSQTSGHFAVACDDGYRIYSCYPFVSRIARHLGFGLKLIELLYDSNIVFFVGDGSSTSFPPTKLVVYDDSAGVIIAELAFPLAVEAIWARPDRIAVAAGHRVYVYTLDDLNLQDVVDVTVPYRALMSLPATGSCVLLTPGARHTNSTANQRSTGVITIPSAPPSTSISGDVTLQNYASLPVSHVDIVAHDHQLTCVTANSVGTMFATSSSRGTLVRVYAFKPLLDLHDGVIVRGGRRVPLVAQFRRARQTNLSVRSLSFSHDCEFLAAGCDGGTVDVFPLADACSKQSSFSPSELGLVGTERDPDAVFPPLTRVSLAQATGSVMVSFAPTLIRDCYALFAACGGSFYRVMLDKHMAPLSVQFEGVYQPRRLVAG